MLRTEQRGAWRLIAGRRNQQSGFNSCLRLHTGEAWHYIRKSLQLRNSVLFPSTMSLTRPLLESRCERSVFVQVPRGLFACSGDLRLKYTCLDNLTNRLAVCPISSKRDKNLYTRANSRSLDALGPLLHLQSQQTGLRARHGAPFIALLLVEEVAAFVSGRGYVSECTSASLVACLTAHRSAGQVSKPFVHCEHGSAYLFLAFLLLVVVLLYAVYNLN